MLPACFVLKLGKKMPICMELIKRIQKVTELECGDISAPHPLLSLIIQHASDGQLDCRNNRGLYVVSEVTNNSTKRTNKYPVRVSRTHYETHYVLARRH